MHELEKCVQMARVARLWLKITHYTVQLQWQHDSTTMRKIARAGEFLSESLGCNSNFEFKEIRRSAKKQKKAQRNKKCVSQKDKPSCMNQVVQLNAGLD